MTKLSPQRFIVLVVVAAGALFGSATASSHQGAHHHRPKHASNCRPNRHRKHSHPCVCGRKHNPCKRHARPTRPRPLEPPIIAAPVVAPVVVPPILRAPSVVAPPVLAPPVVAPSTAIQHVVVIVMENSGASVLSQMPYLNGLANANASATNYFAIGHFSADNYIAMTSGTTCCFDDSFQNLSSTPNIFRQLGSQAQTLAERGGGGYAQRHDPGAYYGLTSLGFTDGQPVDLTGKKFTFVVPGLCDDMHDCGPSTGDGWLSRNVPTFLANPGTVVFVTFDEGSGGGQGATTPPANHIAMVIAGAGVHGTDATAFTHYSLLRTIEDMLGLPCLGSACSATTMVGHFGL